MAQRRPEGSDLQLQIARVSGGEVIVVGREHYVWAWTKSAAPKEADRLRDWIPIKFYRLNRGGPPGRAETAYVPKTQEADLRKNRLEIRSLPVPPRASTTEWFCLATS